MTATQPFVSLYDFRMISILPRDLLYSHVHATFNLYDALRVTEVGLHAWVDKIVDERPEMAAAVREKLPEINEINEQIRHIADDLMAARKRYQAMLDDLNAIVEEKKRDA